MSAVSFDCIFYVSLQPVSQRLHPFRTQAARTVWPNSESSFKLWITSQLLGFSSDYSNLIYL